MDYSLPTDMIYEISGYCDTLTTLRLGLLDHNCRNILINIINIINKYRFSLRSIIDNHESECFRKYVVYLFNTREQDFRIIHSCFYELISRELIEQYRYFKLGGKKPTLRQECNYIYDYIYPKNLSNGYRIDLDRLKRIKGFDDMKWFLINYIPIVREINMKILFRENYDYKVKNSIYKISIKYFDYEGNGCGKTTRQKNS